MHPIHAISSLPSASLIALLVGLGLQALAPSALDAQPVTTPWGNIEGIRVEGELMAFESSLRAVDPDWAGFVQSSKYNWEGKASFALEGNTHTCTHFLQGTELHYTTRVTDLGRGQARVEQQTELRGELSTAGIHQTFTIPAADYLGAKLEFLGADLQPLPALADHTGAGKELARVKARGFRLTGARRMLEVLADEETELLVRQDLVSQPDHLNDPLPRRRFVASDPLQAVADFQVYLQVLPRGAAKGVYAKTGYTVRVSGTIDREPVHFAVEPLRPGRAFAGIGGNFRMQMPELDGQVVDYCLEQLKVTWGRVAFPWAEWQPEEKGDRAAEVLAGTMSPGFYAQLEMARDLARRRIPIIASVWMPPAWAVDKTARLPKGVKLDPAKLQQAADSVASWLVFLKQQHGIEVALFSFNETDYGVEVHQNGEEHALANKVFGTTFARRGLVTRMLLGDTGACTLGSHKLVGPSAADPALRAYLGGIAFHTYHGLTPDALKAWADTARSTGLPLLCTEGGPDSAAHRYPLIFVTPWFAQLEIDQYVRICATCEPATIMPWQLNADYSPLQGGGIYGDEGPLRPTQRFWGLKQLGALPPGAFWLPVSTQARALSCAALGDRTRNAFALHVTNNGATRKATVSGIPDGVKKLRVLITDATRGMELQSVKGVVGGKVSFVLEAGTFTSLVSE